ncbi:restriction endonuclease subunit S [Brachyspira hyodysenteriae]|uniref:restriction endonuclease subunit S n=2 Tax=Brachyspira hyodysenteriae TaxID=159 RepID=UPI0011841E2B|nr:restriction endonuclease subunit S [Brachyspira hyodysenteriae]TVL79303.1 hypothetical protein A9X82_06160 [Brachyspira hyodysenteriae]
MSLLENLIKKHCPDGVEYKKLYEVISILDNLRKPVSKDKRTKGIYPYYGANGIQDYVDNYIFDGTFILMGEDGSVINKDNSPVLNWASGKIWVNNHAHVLFNDNINTLRFIFYYLQTIDISNIVRGTPPKINQQNLRNIEIPLPPIEIQKEIVRILDEFTLKTTELQELLHKEYISRKKQYEYYRDKLLTFGDDVEYRKISDILTIKSGNNKIKKQEGKYPVYGSTGIIAYSDDYVFNEPNILIARVGVNAGYIHIANGLYDVSDNTLIVTNININIHFKYMYYILINARLNNYIKGGGVPLITAGQIKNILIPVPPLEEQERIVKILDRFDALCNDISSGLPAEIEMRKKQYEYYRDKLLTFKEKKIKE